jgi:amidase
MGTFKEYDEHDALGIAQLIRKKSVSPLEVCEEAIERIESLNPKINAVIYRMFDAARAQAGAPLLQGPFAGVPFLCKDLVTYCAGAPFTRGSKSYRNYVPDRDSELMTRYKATGVLILGKTNTPEFGLMGITEPELHGPTRNPWNVNHTPGGSSGGSAAAVAGGMVPMASGGDGGGSIRIPASCCGVFGLKPTRGRSPLGPDNGEIWQGAEMEHVITRSVRDCAAMLDAVCGPDAGAPYIIPKPERPYASEATRDPGRLRIAFTLKSPLGGGVDPECKRAVEGAARLLEEMGHTVEEADAPVDGVALAKSYFMMYFGETAADVEELRAILGRKARPADVEAATWALNLLGRSFSAGEFVASMREWNTFSRQMAVFLQERDCYLTPTLAAPPVRIGELGLKSIDKLLLDIVSSLNLGWLLRRSGMADAIAMKSLAKTPFTQLANVTGLPAMSVPLHWTSEGLPCGVQFVARFGEESLLFRLAGQLEKARPWFDKRPVL